MTNVPTSARTKDSDEPRPVQREVRGEAIWLAVLAAFLGLATAVLAGNSSPLRYAVAAGGGVLVILMVWQAWVMRTGSVLSICFVAVLAALLFAVAIESLIQARGIDRHDADVSAIRKAIEDATTGELSLYQHPTWPLSTSILGDFVPVDEGGGALAQAEEIACRLRSEGHRYSTVSSHALFFDAISVDSDRAFVKTDESWYLPVVNEKRSAVFTVIQLNGQQLYFLVKEHERWLVKSNPAPEQPTLPSDCYAPLE